MSNMLQNKQVEAEPEEEALVLLSPGTQLKIIREELNLSREDVAENMYMTVSYIKALEEDEYHKLPGMIFVKGYFKIYANYLNADEDKVLASYVHHAQAFVDSESDDGSVTRSGKSQTSQLFWIFLAILIIAVGIAFAWWFK